MFPNIFEGPLLCTIMKIFLTIPVSVATAERSFSKSKMIKNYLRSSMSQCRLQGLSILSIEANKANQINYDDAVDIFASAKSRRKAFNH